MNWLVLLMCASLPAGRAEVIDRIAVVVGNSAITESEIRREIRLTAFLNGEMPVFTGDVKRKTAERLVEQRLIRREFETANYPPPPDDAVEEMLRDLRENQYHNDGAAYAAALQRAGISEDELKAHFRRQLATLRFIDYRFRPGIQVSDDEMKQYFDQRLLPELSKSQPGKEFSFDEFRDQVEDALIEERVNQEADRWLKEAKTRTRIEFRPEVFKK